MSSATVIKGDCLEEMAKLPPGSVDLIVTSPPYNVGIDYGDGASDSMEYTDYLSWLDEVWASCKTVLCDGGRLCVNVADTDRNPYRALHADITTRLVASGWGIFGIIIWSKGQMSNATAWGSWMSASAPSLRGTHEFIVIAYKGDKKKAPRNASAPSGPYTSEEFMDLTREVWEIMPETHSNHPAPFPYKLPFRLIKLYSFVGDVVLDPFSGSGTTLRAAIDLDRSAIGIERSPRFARMSRERVAQIPMMAGVV